MNKQIGLIGLGKMGSNLALNLQTKGWQVVVHNRTATKVAEFQHKGFVGAYSVEELVTKLDPPRLVWLMLTAGEPTQQAIFGPQGLVHYLMVGDIIIEGGNSHFRDDLVNASKLAAKGIKYVDVGVSGGPAGARHGACCMIGGQREVFEYLEELFRDISAPSGYKFFPGHGAGHFVKMVHNGIEYGMMQAIAEGFNLMKHCQQYNLNLLDIADIYNHGSVIQSRLTEWLQAGYLKYGTELTGIAGTVGSNGEGLWTVNLAKEQGLDVRVLDAAVQFRFESQTKPSYLGQILTMLRHMFGGHSIEKNRNT